MWGVGDAAKENQRRGAAVLVLYEEMITKAPPRINSPDVAKFKEEICDEKQNNNKKYASQVPRTATYNKQENHRGGTADSCATAESDVASRLRRVARV